MQCQYEERIIAYIDILGFKDAVNKSETDQEEIENICEMLDVIKRFSRIKLYSIMNQ